MKSDTHCPLGASMENNIFPCPSGNDNIDNSDGPTRKRKSVAVDLPRSLSDHCVAWDSNMQNVSSLSGTNGEGNIYEQSSSQVNCLGPTNLGHQFGNNQIHCENDFSETRSISNRNFFRAAAERTSNPSVSVQPFPVIKMLSQGTPEMQNCQPHHHVLLGQNEVDRSLSSEIACNGDERKPEICPRLREQMGLGINNHILTDELPKEACIASPDHLRPVERFQHAFLQPSSFFDSLNLRNSSQKANSDGSNLLTARTDSFGGSICKNLSKNDRISQNQGKFGRDNFTDHLGDASEGRKLDNGGSDINLDKENKASNVGTMDCSSKEKFSSKAGSSTPAVLGHGQRTNSTDVSVKLDDKNVLISGMATSAAGEKLWDGSLQLNSSVTVSAVAFFKSGEKLLDTNWSEFVEVKGKVRLEAFEKYVQDLPRSRTRGLMVISLCCKEGSSDTGFIGMKKVAKGYKNGEKVGLAQLSPAIDLYICPRSDKIITILAKYGFYKGMAAIEGNQDSLIGCVVWRKNRASTNTVAAKSEGKNSSLDMRPKSSEFSSQHAAKKNSSPVQLAQEVISFTAARPFLTPESVEGSAMEAKKVEAVEISVEVVSNSSAANSLLTYSAPISCSYNLEAHASSHDGFIQGSGGNLVGPKASHRPFSGVVQPQGQVLGRLQGSTSSAVMKDSIAANDDDLPEFDFRTACGHSATITRKPSGAVLPGKTFPAGKIRTKDGFKTSTLPTLESISLSCRRSDNSTLPSSSVNQEMPLVRANGDSEPLVSLSYNLEDKSHVKSLATATTPSIAFGSAKNFFNDLSKKNNNIFDDDDMPEWCPPELLKQSSVEGIRPFTTGPSYFSNLTIHNLWSGAQRPLLPSSSAAAAHLMISSQASPAFHDLPHVNVVMPTFTAVQSATDPVKWFGCNPVLRPQFSSINSNFSFQSADRRGWRPAEK